MRQDNRLVCITLTHRPNGKKMRAPKPMRIAKPDAERLADAGRAIYIKKSDYKAAKAKFDEENKRRKPKKMTKSA